MRFKISASSCWNTDKFLLEYGSLLEPWALETEEEKRPNGNIEVIPVIRVNSLGSLAKLQLAVGHELIFSFARREIEIYDYYRE